MNIRFTSFLGLIVLATFPTDLSAQVDQISGFTEPFRQIELASDETGAIAKLAVEEGMEVRKGDILAQLDDRVQKLQVESAKHLLNSRSALTAARKTLEKRQLIAERIKQLISTGHATESEIIRADLEQSIAQSKYIASEEEAIGREIDLRRAELMLERRTIRAPFDSVVAVVHRRHGEFLSPLRPEVVSLIQVDHLLAVFNVASDQIEPLKKRKNIEIEFENGQKVIGQLHSIGVQTDAESGTVQVKIRLDNATRDLRSGEKCYLEL